ncbi:hypothetical protein FB451DRAFT_1237111 [Mycena latifolia]|nr:hypothetical protein FB451DRAFT_1237111 [Mycena latifolia]
MQFAFSPLTAMAIPFMVWVVYALTASMIVLHLAEPFLDLALPLYRAGLSSLHQHRIAQAKLYLLDDASPVVDVDKFNLAIFFLVVSSYFIITINLVRSGFSACFSLLDTGRGRARVAVFLPIPLAVVLLQSQESDDARLWLVLVCAVGYAIVAAVALCMSPQTSPVLCAAPTPREVAAGGG